MESLALVRRELATLGVETERVSIRSLLKMQASAPAFDLIYVSGLHDYLSLRIAQGLSEVLFVMLNPCGRLLLSNYLPNPVESGYMEAFVDWWLIYRSHEKLRQLVATHPEAQREGHRGLDREEWNYWLARG